MTSPTNPTLKPCPGGFIQTECPMCGELLYTSHTRAPVRLGELARSYLNQLCLFIEDRDLDGLDVIAAAELRELLGREATDES